MRWGRSRSEAFLTHPGGETCKGFTLLEVMVALAFFIIALLGISSGVMEGVKTTGELQREQIVKGQAQIFINRLMSLNFGQPGDPVPTASQLDELFDDDDVIGAVTLMSLSKAPAEDGGWRFELAGFPVQGQWLVTVTQDLNGDGNVQGVLEEGGQLLRITVAFDGDVILSTVRGRETQT